MLGAPALWGSVMSGTGSLPCWGLSVPRRVSHWLISSPGVLSLFDELAHRTGNPEGQQVISMGFGGHTPDQGLRNRSSGSSLPLILAESLWGGFEAEWDFSEPYFFSGKVGAIPKLTDCTVTSKYY